jgi:hypothetical protein
MRNSIGYLRFSTLCLTSSRGSLFIGFTCSALLLLGLTSASAQQATPTPQPTYSMYAPGSVTGEGISGDVDSKRRGPVVGVGSRVSASQVQLLIDAHIPNPEYRKYPIRFDIYVNRHLEVSQIRATEVPGAVGLTLARSEITLPFNYSVVATLLHPNREFATIVHGAVFEASLSRSLDCTLTLTSSASVEEESSNSTEFQADDVTSTQPNSSSLELSFEAQEAVTEDADSADVKLSASVASSSDTQGRNALSGTLTVKTDETPKTYTVEGSALLSDGLLGEFSVSSADGSVELECSSAT